MMTEAPPTPPTAETEWKNLFGVCACLGEDFGINPLWLRLGFALPLIYAPMVVVAVYVGLGVLVLATRLLFPNPKRRAVMAPVAEAEEPMRLAA